MAYTPTRMAATFFPGRTDDLDYYEAPRAPDLVSPAPQRHMPEMSDQISDGLANMNFNRASAQPSPFPRLQNLPSNIPPSDEDFESTLERARTAVLGSNDPEMQLAWAQDALQHVGIEVDNSDRLRAMQLPYSGLSPAQEQIKTDSMNIVGFLADQHHPKAEFLRGMWWEFGRFGVKVDKKEAFRCYSRAADRAFARAEYRIGMLHEASNDPIKALKHYHRGVDAGDSACLYRLGMMTLRGQHGQARDYHKGVDLIRQSAMVADENAAQGAYVYGMLLARQLPQVDLPDGVLQPDERAARVEIEKAAYLRFAKAQLKMGSAYELGMLSCDFNPTYSLHYYALAAKQGETEAEIGISKWFLVGHEGLFPKNEEQAYLYALRAANSGLPNAEFAMGYFNELGIHVPQDLDKALDWYKKAARNGNTDAKGRIDGISKKQVLSRRDHENVAITRIKSQYGSRKGGRPQRFQQPSSLPGIVDQPAAEDYMHAGSGVPPRPSSTTPYPVHDGPPQLPPVGATRPPSVVPYPLEDGIPGHQRPASSTHGPMMSPPLNARPGSAFGVLPDQRSASAAMNRNRYPSGPNGPAQGPRPGNAMDQRRPPPNSRIVSSPAGMANRPYATPPPMPGLGRPAIQIGSPQPDIGFVAPLDSRRARPSQRPPYDTEKPLPPPAGPNASGLPGNLGAERPYAQRTSSRPNLASQTNNPVPNVSAPQPPSQPGTPAPTATAGKPPGKGPKTFEEMGVPATKQDSECIVM